MSTDVQNPDTRQDPRALLTQAGVHADAGQGQPALAQAQAALQLAQACADDRACAEALLLVACIELRLLGHFDAALADAQRAVAHFQQLTDVDGECRALSTQAIAASRLGCYEMAVDSALLAVKLSDQPRATAEQVMAYHALGIAMFSGKCFVEASNAYQRAIALAQRCEPPLNAFELHSDLAATESFRYMAERNAGGSRLSLDMLEIHVNHCLAQLARADVQKHIAPASHTNNLLILALTQVHLLTWRRQLDEAEQQLGQLRARNQALQRPWLLAATEWGHAELALARGDLDQALARVQAMVAVADEHHHEGLLGIGLQMLAYVCERRQELPAALRALRQLQQHEQRARSQSLKGRLDVIERQVDLRHKAQQLQRLEHDTRLYQRLAMEDGLTGLANRRQLETVLQAALALPGGAPDSAAPVCLALIDIDRFKQVNDRHSHQTGDAVLCAIAQLMRTHTRDSDLPARLAGDEFVILLRDPDLAQARRVCRRLQAAVRSHDWAALAPGLQVSISVGLAAAEAGDTLVSLMQRADARMYADKRR